MSVIHPSLPPENFSEYSQVFKDHEWLEHIPLNEHTALEYFSRSPFFLRGCLNEQAARSGVTMQALVNHEGISFDLEFCNPPLFFVIARIQRTSVPSRKGTVIIERARTAMYYILHGSIYKIPTLGSIIASRSMKACSSINKVLNIIREQVDFEPAETLTCNQAYNWNFLKSKNASEKKVLKPVEAAPAAIPNLDYSSLVEAIMKAYPLDTPDVPPIPPKKRLGEKKEQPRSFELLPEGPNNLQSARLQLPPSNTSIQSNERKRKEVASKERVKRPRTS
eukprot:TRINITY_DN42114_c0_g1_i1.p1 TRINITY_DN42114_c0_g1~~TRINITY_DN42114_c0_g1_i1.p1  ORF type:complete len:279 (+),score=21.05 TRINITY_DN42114_c0_g1_i1:18-854(+)